VPRWHQLALIKRARRDPARKPITYLTVHLRCADGDRRKTAVHKLVLSTFVGACPPGLEACHNNGRHTDNRLRNLRWDTRGSNMRDRYKHGNGLRGVMFKRARLTDGIVRAIRSSKLPPLALAREYKVHHNTVYGVLRRETWKHVE